MEIMRREREEPGEEQPDRQTTGTKGTGLPGGSFSLSLPALPALGPPK